MTNLQCPFTCIIFYLIELDAVAISDDLILYHSYPYTGWLRKNATPMITNFKEIRD